MASKYGGIAVSGSKYGGIPVDVPKDTRGFLARTFAPRKEDFPEYPVAVDSSEDALAVEQQFGTKGLSDLVTGGPKTGTDKYGNPIITTDRGTFYINKPGLSVNDISQAFGAAGDIVKSAAPYIAGGIATAPAKAVLGIAAQGGIGLVSEALDQTENAISGQEVDASKLWKTPLFSMLGDSAGRAAYAIASPVVTKLLGKAPDFKVTNPDGTLTDDTIKILEERNLTPEEFDSLASFEIAKKQRQGVLSKEEAERYNFLKQQGLDPTTAQVTRTADDFQSQQELAKRSTAVRSQLEGQEGVISEAFDTRIRGAGAPSTGSPISDAVLNKAVTLDTEISNLYQQARETLPPDKNIKLGKFFDTLRRKGPSNQATGGVISSIRGYLKDSGLQGGTTTTINAAGAPVRVSTASPVGVGQAEAVRIELNRLYANANREGRAVIRTLKDAIDEDVLKIAGTDYFEQARAAKSAFESGLRPELLSKFDANESSLVRDILDNTIKGDDVFQNVVLSRSWKPSDIKELKSYLTSGGAQQVEQGTTAWNSLRSDTIQWIKDQAFKGPVDAAGNQAMTRAGIESAIRKIGRPRLEAILSEAEVSFLDDMVKVASLREPVRGTALGLGPSGQLAKSIESKISRYPILTDLWDAIKTSKQGEQMTNPAAATIKAVTAPEPVLTKDVLTGLSSFGAASGGAVSGNRK